MIHNTEEEKKVLLEYALTLIQGVLHGKYANSSFGERIEHQDGFVYLRNASSGQQEAIRIVQDAFLSIYQDEATFRIVEEPEAHLFPTAQKSVIELLVLSRNARKENQLVVTTHSPYTLTVINNLIYAYQTGQRNMQEVNDTIRKELWVNPDDVAAYLLNNGTATDIMDEDLRQIRAELIDGVSKEINAQYDKLLEFDDNEGE